VRQGAYWVCYDYFMLNLLQTKINFKFKLVDFKASVLVSALFSIWLWQYMLQPLEKWGLSFARNANLIQVIIYFPTELLARLSESAYVFLAFSVIGLYLFVFLAPVVLWAPVLYIISRLSARFPVIGRNIFYRSVPGVLLIILLMVLSPSNIDFAIGGAESCFYYYEGEDWKGGSRQGELDRCLRNKLTQVAVDEKMNFAQQKLFCASLAKDKFYQEVSYAEYCQQVLKKMYTYLEQIYELDAV
jgi:hypothetical protein